MREEDLPLTRVCQFVGGPAHGKIHSLDDRQDKYEVAEAAVATLRGGPGGLGAVRGGLTKHLYRRDERDPSVFRYVGS